MAMILNPDIVLGLAGIGPKSMEAIKVALENISFPEPVLVVEPIVETPVETVAEPRVEPVIEIAPAESMPEMVPAEGDVVPVPVENTLAEAAEKPLEEIFVLSPDMLQPVAVATDDDEEESDKKKDKKKKKKVVQIVYDEAIAKKKHKRSDEGWEEE
jgi:hypothetical protein